MKHFYLIVILFLFCVAIHAQEEKNRLDWSNSPLYISLKEYCKKDYKVNDSTIFRVFDKYHLNIQDIYSSYYEARPMARIIAENKLIHPGEEKPEYPIDELNGLYFALKSLLKNKSIVDIYWDILLNNGFIYSKKEIPNIYHQDENEEIVKELQSLHAKWKDMTTNNVWEKYALSKSGKFMEVASMLDSVLEIRNNRQFKEGVIKRTYGANDDIKTIEIPYKVVGNELVADGICILTSLNKQYANATGEKYKSHTHNVRIVLKVENGVAVSKSFSGDIKTWNEDNKVYERSKGSHLQKIDKMLKAKPALVKTEDISKLDADLIYPREFIERFLKIDYIKDENLFEYCKQCLQHPYQYRIKEDLESLTELPLKKIDLSNLYPKFSSKN